MEQQHRYYQVGAVALDVSSALPEVLSDLELLYGWFRTDSPSPNALFFEILLESSNPRAKPDYVVRTPDRDFIAGPDRRAVMPELVAALNQQIIRRRLDVMHFHAGVMSFEGQGVLMPAYSGTGKTTLVSPTVSVMSITSRCTRCRSETPFPFSIAANSSRRRFALDNLVS